MAETIAPPADFAEILSLEVVGGDHYQAVFDDASDYDGPIFGGVTLGCATLAGGLTCPDRPIASLHMTFLRPVPQAVPVDFVVTRVRDGRRLAHRRVDVRVEGKLAGEMIMSFAAPEKGRAELLGQRDPADVPKPEDLRSHEEMMIEEGADYWEGDPLEWRYPDRPWEPAAGATSDYRGWVRPRIALADKPWLHAASIAYLSDCHSHLPVARLLNAHFEPIGFTSLDTKIWFHRAEPWSDWRLIESVCDIGHGGRGLMQRRLFARDGRLLVTMAQEALIPGDSAEAGSGVFGVGR
jgi:acyl-CoA thioesterase-2